jgi:(R,R)-butanediol dehydrogenase/meso-butanediol dehydrogenase/diacetyl reductase
VKAVRWHGRDDVRLDEVPVPVPTDTEVLIRIEAVGICGTDVDEVRQGPIIVPLTPHPVSGRSAPMTLGHEMVGVVAEAGAGSGVSVGSRVAPWPSRPCGACAECGAGFTNRCPRTVALGMSADGGMADYLVVDGSRCVPLDGDVALERAVLVEPYAVALHGVDQVDLEGGARVAVVGTGSLGLCVIECLVLVGAAEIIAVSRSEAARTAALEAGATRALPPDEAAGIAADVVFETAGAAAAVETSIAAARRGGRLVVLGGHLRPIPIDLLDLVVREIAIQGSLSHTFADFEAAARAIERGDLARVRRTVEIAGLDAGPRLLRADASSAKRILVPGAP